MPRRKRRGGRPRTREPSKLRIADIRDEIAKGGQVQSVLVICLPKPRSYMAFARVSWRRGYHPLRESRDRGPRKYRKLDNLLWTLREYFAGPIMLFSPDDPQLKRLKPFWPQTDESGPEEMAAEGDP